MKDTANSAETEIIAEMPLACADELAAIQGASGKRLPYRTITQ